MTQQEKDKQAVEFSRSIIKKLKYFIDRGIMDSFEINFRHKDKKYQLVLINKGKLGEIDKI